MDLKEKSGELGVEEKTSKVIFVIRHGQAEHNLLFEKGLIEECVNVLDPALTTKGIEQAVAVQSNPLLPASVELIVCSPLRRTIETCCLALEKMMKNNAIPVVLHPDLQEVGAKNCNTGTPKETVIGDFLAGFPEINLVNTSMLSQTSHIKAGRYKDDDGEEILQRFEDLLLWLEKRPEKKIVIVAHHHSILFMTGISFMNCELRQFYLSPGAKKLTPLAPPVSTCDAQLSTEELAHLKSHLRLIRAREKLWGIEFHGRLR